MGEAGERTKTMVAIDEKPLPTKRELFRELNSTFILATLEKDEAASGRGITRSGEFFKHFFFYCSHKIIMN